MSFSRQFPELGNKKLSEFGFKPFYPEFKEWYKMTKEANKKPVKKFRSGQISATIWENKILLKDGKEIDSFSVSIEKSYTKDDGKTWESTNNFNMTELSKVILVTNKAYEFLYLKEE